MALKEAVIEHFSTRQHFDNTFDIMSVKVLPGEYYATKDEVMITTLLGSCVSVCLYDPTAKVGGMNHFLLPEGGDANDLLSSAGRYGVYAMELLINHLIKLGARREHFKAKVFGGGSVIKGMTTHNIGKKNVDFIQSYLQNEGISIESSDLLDIYPRRVNFFPSTGRVMMKKLRQHHDTEAINCELRYRKAISSVGKDNDSGDVDLF
ncbi:chemoreceptor glutamine deamidase CheD [Marinomonas polaris]|uniref:chemoreceptor glutamine deamidase CheD n=1 Tax=Marinomonas polaris TaxID=293552 RepID=UPI003F9AD27B